MKIAFYSHYFVPEIGAPPARIFDLAREWIARGQEVDVVTCFPNHPTGKLYPGYERGGYTHETIEGIEVHRHWTYITPNKGFIKKTLGHISYWPAARLFSDRHVRQTDVAIGTSPTFFAAMAAASRARRQEIPFAMEVRDLWPAIFVELGVVRNPTVIRLLERWELSLYRRAARIVTVTEAFRENLIGRGVPARKIATIPNGADIEYWQPQRAPAPLRAELSLEGKFVVLYIGAHGISHALGRILDAAALLRENRDVVFVFVGEGAERAVLMERAQQAGLANVRFHAPVEKARVRDFYALADVCLVPLRNIPLFETFIPSKMFEIMAMERPIVASVKGESAEILTRSEAAVVVEPENSQAIADAIIRLQANPQERQAMSAKGRRFVADHYSRRSLAAKYLQVLDEAIGEHKAGRQ